MDKSFLDKFVLSVANALDEGFESKRIGLGVSGGADSIALLTALRQIAALQGQTLFVVTVNHNIRPPVESLHDAQFVERYCALLDDIYFECIQLKAGQVKNLAAERDRGVEDAARFLRYQAFDAFIAKHNLDFFCLGHNQNDQFETLLQRFLQGSSALGIAETRGTYRRPLLDIDRKDIVRFLDLQSISYCIDASNNENDFFRNRIRNVLVPVLDQHFEGWKNSVLLGAEKRQADEDVFSAQLDSLMRMAKISESWNGKQLAFDAGVFFSQPLALRIRIIEKSLDMILHPHRVSYSVMKGASLGQKKTVAKNLEIVQTEADVLIKSFKNYRNKQGFFAIVYEPGIVTLPHGSIIVREKMPDSAFNGCLGPFFLPIVIRSRLPSDTVKTVDGLDKQLSHVLMDWKVPEAERDTIPIIETDGCVQCVIGSAAGYSDWMVKSPLVGVDNKITVYIRFQV